MLSLLNRPFFTGQFPAAPTFPTYPLSPYAGVLTVPAPRTVLLDGVQYAVDTKEYRHSSRRTLRDSAAINGEATDSLFDTQGAWARYRHSWHLGGGQRLDDLGDENLSTYRFLTASNFHIWTNGELRYQIGWLDTQTFTGGAATIAKIVAANGYVLAATGADTRKAPAGTYESPAWASITGLSGTVTSISTDGTQFFIGTSSGLYTLAATATAASLLSAGNVDTVVFAANRLLVGDANALYEVSSGGTRTVLTTHFQSSFRWSVVFAIGSKIYVGGRAGTRSEIYTLATDQNGVLIRSTEAAPFQTGELLQDAVAYAGFVIILTSLGARFAQVGADGTLTYGPVITPDREVDRPTSFEGLAVGGGYAWFGCVLGDGSHCLVEMDLSTFTDTLTPAWTKVAVRPSGQVQYQGMTYVGSNTSEVTRKSLVGVSRTANRVGTYSLNAMTSTNYAAVCRTGLIRFGTIEEKVLVELDVGFDPLPSGSSVTAAVYDEEDVLVATGTASTAGVSELNVGLGNTVTRGCYVVLTFTPADDTELTAIRWWRMRAYPVVPPVQEWILPIIAHENVLMGEGEGAHRRQNPKAIRDAVHALWAAKTPTSYMEGDATYTVRVEDFEIRPSKWSTDGKYFQPLVLARLVAV